LGEHLPQFEQLGVRVTCIVQGDARQAESYCARHGLAGRCLGDPEKSSYRTLGFPRTRWRDLLFGPADLKRRRKEAAATGCANSLQGARESHSDVLQLPGAALVARDGRILWLHRASHPGDLPLAPELLRVVRAQLGKG